MTQAKRGGGVRSREVHLAPSVEFYFDGKPLRAHNGDSIAAALLDNSVTAGAGKQAQRGLFCCMGLCQQCLVYVDGAKTEACLARVSEGLRVESAPAPEPSSRCR